MDKRRLRKHKGQKRSLVLCNQHRPLFDGTPGGAKNVATLETAVAQQAAPLDREGVLPALRGRVASGLRASKNARAPAAFPTNQYTRAPAGLDQALGEGDDALDVIESILVASPDAPVGVLKALRQARLIGPRDAQDNHPANGRPGQTAPAAAPTPTASTTAPETIAAPP